MTRLKTHRINLAFLQVFQRQIWKKQGTFKEQCIKAAMINMF